MYSFSHRDVTVAYGTVWEKTSKSPCWHHRSLLFCLYGWYTRVFISLVIYQASYSFIAKYGCMQFYIHLGYDLVIMFPLEITNIVTTDAYRHNNMLSWLDCKCITRGCKLCLNASSIQVRIELILWQIWSYHNWVLKESIDLSCKCTVLQLK